MTKGDPSVYFPKMLILSLLRRTFGDILSKNNLYKIMKKVIIVLFFFFITDFIDAQVPGYQGKRTVVEVHGSFPIVQSNSNEPLIYKIHAEYAIKRTKAVALEVRYANQPREYSTGIGVTRTSVMAYYMNYTQDWSLAPFGRYLGYGLALNSVNEVVPNVDPKFARNTTDIYPSVHFTFGKRYILANRISVNLGSEAGLPLSRKAYQGRSDASGILFNVHAGLGVIF
jgi:hypothetical protein